MKNNSGQEEKLTILYGHLSDDDGSDIESNSISNQRTILQDYAKKHGYLRTRFICDDGVSGTTFDRPGFREMESLIEEGKVSTVIVKDLSRFGRNYLEVGRYLEVLYPTLGVKFIAIQENVDTMGGKGLEMIPFHNIFNEWYAAQTSKKIRAVNAMKAANGKRVSTLVPYGYRKDPEDHEKWLIDPPAAEIVRKIYSLCISGRGPTQIARQLENEKVLTPAAYCESVGRPSVHKPPKEKYHWDSNTVIGILENRQYTGCTVNNRTTTLSYKLHKTVYRPEEEWQIIPDTQEAIIDEDTWMRVQELRKNKRRNAATGRKSIFAGLLYCADCGAKLHFCAAKSLSRSQEYYRCSNYKNGRGTCGVHYIRDIVLQKIVLEAVTGLSVFARCYESVFLLMLAQRDEESRKAKIRQAQAEQENCRRRIREIDRIIAQMYEDNVSGKISDERFSRMSLTYEFEQKKLEKTAAEADEVLRNAEQKTADLRMLLKGLRGFSELKELTPEIVNTLIRRIEVHSSDKSSGQNRVKVDIYFTAVGMIDLPTEKELSEMTFEIRKKQSA